MISPKNTSKASGFTLVELLLVMSIIITLASLAVASMRGMMSRNLVMGGNMIVDLTNQARQNSMAKGTMSALVMVTNSANKAQNNRSFIVLELAHGSSTWVPVTKWDTLPEGVLADPTQSADFFDDQNLPQIGPVHCGPTVLQSTDYVYQIFMPQGGLLQANNNLEPPTLRLVEGFMTNSTIKSTSEKDFYDVIINPLTGIPKADRP